MMSRTFGMNSSNMIASSRVLYRIAINKKSRQLYAIYNSNDTLYRYCSLPKDSKEIIEGGGYALGRIMNFVKKRCPSAQLWMNSVMLQSSRRAKGIS